MEHPLRKIPRKNWPQQVETLAEVIGEEAALNLFIRFNGRHLHVPITCPAGHLIEQTIGADKAGLLCKQFGGENFLFPKGAFLLMKIHNNNILSDWKAGMTQADIATKYDLSSRRIHTIISESKMEAHHV